MADDVHFFENQISGKADEIYDYAPFIGSTGDFQRLSGIDVAIHSIRSLLMTPLGHYPFDPKFGSLLFKKLFELGDEITKTEIEYEVRERIRMYEDRVEVEKVESSFFEGGKGISVNVYIDRDGVKGKVSAYVSTQNKMFGLEDEITAGLP